MANVAPAELAKEFRSMLMKVAQKLTEDEMSQMSYEEGFTLELPPGSTGLQDMRVHFLLKLEAKGVFSPKNPDGFAGVLKRLSREDLIVEVNKYKQNHLRGNKKLFKSKSKDVIVKKPSEAKQSITTTEYPQDNLEDMFALAMTHASNLMSVLEELRDLMQQPIPRDRLAAVTPQVKEAIVMLSKEEQTVVSVCESLKKVSAETKTSVNTSNQSSPKPLKGVHSTFGRKKSSETLSPMSIVYKKKTTPPSPTSTTEPFAIGPKSPLTPQNPENDYSEVVSMTTLGEGYGNYDQIPATKHAQLKADVIYDVVANYCPEESSPTTQTEEANKDISLLGEASSGGSKTSDKLASESGGPETKDQLPITKKPSDPTPVKMEELISPAQANKKRQPYMELLIMEDEEKDADDADYTDLIKLPEIVSKTNL